MRIICFLEISQGKISFQQYLQKILHDTTASVIHQLKFFQEVDILIKYRQIISGFKILKSWINLRKRLFAKHLGTLRNIRHNNMECFNLKMFDFFFLMGCLKR